jgi:hypothetical protein
MQCIKRRTVSTLDSSSFVVLSIYKLDQMCKVWIKNSLLVDVSAAKRQYRIPLSVLNIKAARVVEHSQVSIDDRAQLEPKVSMAQERFQWTPTTWNDAEDTALLGLTASFLHDRLTQFVESHLWLTSTS